MSIPHIAILGGGPAGVGAAFQLRRLDCARVTLLEQQPGVGGNAGSFSWRGQRLDYGSHRLHPACDSAILSDIRSMLGRNLLDRPRHGRIRLRGRWIHFPLKPLDLFRRLDSGFGIGVAGDILKKAITRGAPSNNSFADVLRASLGETICRDFYFPYARKIWGVDATELSGIQAKRRVSANSFAKLIRKVASQIPALKPPGGGRFFYPQEGFGQITESYAREAAGMGADIRLGTRVTVLEPPGTGRATWIVGAKHDGGAIEVEADQIWSTLPITLLPRIVSIDVPAEVPNAALAMQFRAMVLVYLALDVGQFSEFDAHYFPQAETRITRLSEPKNYAASREPHKRTVVCAELPCSVDDETWTMSDESLGHLVAEDLAATGIPLSAPPVDVHVRRLRQAYPIYLRSYERFFDVLTTWVNQLPQLVTFGRQGLFAHDNTHHALAMAYGAVQCVEGIGFSYARWKGYLEQFATHVVED
jgi:protoporphyrinogen oxidase